MSKGEKLRKSIIALLSLLIIWAGVKLSRFLVMSGKKNHNMEAPSRVAEVEVVRVRVRDVPVRLTGYGTVRGKRETPIIPEVEGKVVYLNPRFQSGKLVDEGEVLFKTDVAALKIRLRQIEAEIERLRTQIKKTGQEKINLERSLTLARDNLELLAKDLERDRALFEKKMLSEQALDASRRAYLQKKNEETGYINQLAMVPIQVEELEKSVAARRAEAAEVELKIEKSVVRAAFRGIVYDKSVEIGQLLGPGRSVSLLADDSAWEIPVELDSRYLGRLHVEELRKNDPPRFDCDVYWEGQETVRWRGRVSRIEKMDEASRTVRVVVEVERDKSVPLELSKGMFCRVELPGRRYSGVIAIPPAALRINDTVYVSEKGRLTIRELKVLQHLEDTVVIGAGLAEGDLVVTSPLNNPVRGMELKHN